MAPSDATSQNHSSSPFLPRLNSQDVILSPCSACKFLRRRCTDNCILAPYFPPSEPHNFIVAHRVFGASNIIKFLKELPEEQRVDAVSSMVYEANFRIRDPVYGCTGAICHLQKQVNQLQTQLELAQAELVDMKAQHSNLLAASSMTMTSSRQSLVANSLQILGNEESLFSDYEDQGSAWDQLWS